MNESACGPGQPQLRRGAAPQRDGAPLRPLRRRMTEGDRIRGGKRGKSGEIDKKEGERRGNIDTVRSDMIK